MVFQNQAQIADLAQIVDRSGGNLEAPLSLRQHQILGGEPVEDFAQRAHAHPILALEPFELELLAGLELA